MTNPSADQAVLFSSFEFHPKIAEAIEKAGYTTPTPIQLQAFPAVLSGSDLMGLARTGSGKTAAYVLPLMHHLAAPQRALRLLIVVPTRELADQVNEVVVQFGRPLGIKSTTIYGGTSMVVQVRNLKQGVDVVVCCPGRLLDHMRQGTISLNSVQHVVLDEADQMFDMGFLPNIRQILRALPARRQNLLFSATMPTEIRDLAMQMLKNPVVLQVDQSAPTSSVSHEIYTVPQESKTPLLIKLLGEISSDSVLIFTRTKHRAKRLAVTLESEGHSVTCLQGNLSQNRRQEAMAGFRSGKYRILVATDIAARGIDVASVSHVINYDMPSTVEAYTHRIGRTGRASREGDAFTFVTHEDEGLVRAIERTLRKPIPRRSAAAIVPNVATDRDTAQRFKGEFDRQPRQQSSRRSGSNRPGSDNRGARPRGGAGASSSGRPSSYGGGSRSQGPSDRTRDQSQGERNFNRPGASGDQASATAGRGGGSQSSGRPSSGRHSSGEQSRWRNGRNSSSRSSSPQR